MPSPDQLRILTVIFFCLLIVLGFKRPIYAVTAYMVLVYCKLSSYYPLFAQIRAELLFAVFILLRVIATGNFFKNLTFTNNPINKYLLYLVLSVTVSFIIAWDHQYSWDMAVYHFIKTLLLYILIMGAVQEKKDLKIFAWSYMCMFCYLAYEPIFGFLTGTGGSQQMYGTNYIAEIGLLSGHVALANNMNQMVPIAGFMILGAESKVERAIALTCFAVFVIALVGSGSRGGVIGLAVTASMVIFFSKHRTKTIMFMLPLLGIVLVALGSTIMHTASRIDNSATGGRLQGLSHGIGMLRKGNVAGVGPGCYLIARQRYFSYRMEAHNLYGQIIGDLGLPGMVVTFLLMREIFRVLLRVRRTALDAGDQGRFYYYLMTGVLVSLIVRLVISKKKVTADGLSHK